MSQTGGGSAPEGDFHADILSVEKAAWRVGAGKLWQLKRIEEEELKQLVVDLPPGQAHSAGQVGENFDARPAARPRAAGKRHRA